MNDTEPPSDPFADVEDTRKIVLGIQKKLVRQDGAAWVIRGITAAALGVLGWVAVEGLGYAQQAAVDHERVERLESDNDAVREDLAAMRASLEAMSRALARIEGRLEREE